jgi:hypothetical protein
VTSSRWCVAASASVVVAALMINCGGAVAVADPGAGTGHGPRGGSSPHPGSAKHSQSVGGGAAPGATPHHAASRHGMAHRQHPQPDPGANATPGGLTPADAAGAQALVAAATALLTTVPKMVVAATGVIPEVTRALAGAQAPTRPLDVHQGSAPNDVTPASPATVTGPEAPVTDSFAQVRPLRDLLGSTSTVADAVRKVWMPVATDVASIQNLIVQAPNVIALIQDIVTSTTNAALPLTQIPSDLASLFGITVVPSESAPGTVDSGALSVVPGATAPAISRAFLSPLAALGALSAVTVNMVPTPLAPAVFGAATVTGEASSSPHSAPITTGGVLPQGLPAFLHAHGGLVVVASLSVLAAVALPGIFGMLVLTGAGMGIGYRQAKAGLVLRATGLMRFAGSGPIGIVRSGSVIALRPNALRSVRASAAGPLEHAA